MLRGDLIDAIFAAADFFGLLEIEGEKESDVHALATNAATNGILEEEQAREITGTEARGAKVI